MGETGESVWEEIQTSVSRKQKSVSMCMRKRAFSDHMARRLKAKGERRKGREGRSPRTPEGNRGMRRGKTTATYHRRVPGVGPYKCGVERCSNLLATKG